MKICFITRFYKPYIRGGAEIYVGRIAEKLVKRGHEVTVITPSPTKTYTEKINDVKVYRISPLNIYNAYESFKKPFVLKIIYHSLDLFNLHSYILIKKILKDEKPEIVHINNYKGLSTSPFRAVKDLNIPLIFTAHDYSTICIKSNLLNRRGQICENQNLPCKIYNKIQKMIIDNKPDIVIAPSKFVLEKLESKGLFKDSKKIVLPNPIELKHENNKKTYDTIDILFVGSLSKHKGPHILIKAFQRVKRENLRLHIAGKGPYSEEMRKLAKDDKRIIFHGFLHGKKLMDMYRMANVTVVPSIWYDNSPMVVYESFICSTPVVGSRIGGIPELVRDGYNGFLFEPGNVDELANILNEISENPKILKKLEKGARKSSEKYDIKEHINKLEEIYRSLTEKSQKNQI